MIEAAIFLHEDNDVPHVLDGPGIRLRPRV
jgi:hypothetical protein